MPQSVGSGRAMRWVSAERFASASTLAIAACTQSRSIAEG